MTSLAGYVFFMWIQGLLRYHEDYLPKLRKLRETEAAMKQLAQTGFIEDRKVKLAKLREEYDMQKETVEQHLVHVEAGPSYHILK